VYIILLGAPGAGKGTQAVNLSKNLDLVHVATGDLFRKALSEGTALGNKANAYMEKGQLVPDEVTIQMVMERLDDKQCAKGVLLDGFPRNQAQAEALDKELATRSKAIDKVVYIKVSESELLKRLSGRRICRSCQAPFHMTDSPPKVEGVCDHCGGELYHRADDNEETVKTRLKVFFAETAPLIEYFGKAGKLLEIDGEGGVDDIGARIMAALR